MKPKINTNGHWAFNVSLRWPDDLLAWPRDTFVHRSNLPLMVDAVEEGLRAGKAKWGGDSFVTADGPFHHHEGKI